MIDDKTLAGWIVELQEALGLTRAEAGQRIGRKASTLSRWAHGTVPKMEATTRRAALAFVAEVAAMKPLHAKEREAVERAKQMLRALDEAATSNAEDEESNTVPNKRPSILDDHTHDGGLPGTGTGGR